MLPRSQMTPQEIIKAVNDKAHAQLQNVVERAFIGLRNRHTHISYRRECGCDYCNFITNSYTDAKLRLHRLKRKLRHIEGWDYYYSDKDSYKIFSSYQMCENEVSSLKDKKKNLKLQIL